MGNIKLEIEECMELFYNRIDEIKEIEYVSLFEAEGRVLAEDYVSPVAVPPFSKSAMDGYAVCAADVAGATKEAPVKLEIIGQLLAGEYEDIKYRPFTAVRVMTGSYIPDGYDAVIRQEDTDYGENIVSVYTDIVKYRNYCPVGEDIEAGQKLFAKGKVLSPVDIGVLASAGIDSAAVLRKPQIAIISTGTELSVPGIPLAPGKIYASIGYTLAAAMKKKGIEVVSLALCVDDEEMLTAKIKEAAEMADMVITTGAVSVGKKDIIPGILYDMGADVLFRGANIKPGTPTIGAVYHGTPLLCLSGNPYAAIANFELYFWGAAAVMLGASEIMPLVREAVCRSEYKKKNSKRRLIGGIFKDGEVFIPDKKHASSMLKPLQGFNCYIDLEENTEIAVGDVVKIREIYIW